MFVMTIENWQHILIVILNWTSISCETLTMKKVEPTLFAFFLLSCNNDVDGMDLSTSIHNVDSHEWMHDRFYDQEMVKPNGKNIKIINNNIQINIWSKYLFEQLIKHQLLLIIILI